MRLQGLGRRLDNSAHTIGAKSYVTCNQLLTDKARIGLLTYRLIRSIDGTATIKYVGYVRTRYSGPSVVEFISHCHTEQLFVFHSYFFLLP